VEIRIHRRARTLEIDFDDGQSFELPAALLRAMTPSAADRGHGGGADGPLPIESDAVGLLDAQPVGAYAVKLVFDDGHDTGLYTWRALYRIGRDKDRFAEEHRRLLAQAAGCLS
jgi:DUF971 family protein